MPVIFKVKLGETGHSLRISVPKPVIDGFGWKKGDELELIVTDKEITLRKSTGELRSGRTAGS
jgi:AbrB family looped-hinge helix DNA binding protein